jgi:hypothetical protein
LDCNLVDPNQPPAQNLMILTGLGEKVIYLLCGSKPNQIAKKINPLQPLIAVFSQLQIKGIHF